MSPTVTEERSRRVSQQRTELVNRAREKWIGRLIDVSRRNNLLYFRELKTGTLDISGRASDALLALFQGESVSLMKLLPDADETTASAKVQGIWKRAVANLEEKGLDTMYLAVGMATWKATDGGRPAEAPVLLVPLVLETRGRNGRNLALKRNGEIQVNLALLHFLDTEFGVRVTSESLIEVLQGDDEGEIFDPQPSFEQLRQAARAVDGFEVNGRMAISNFSFQKMAMVRDLLELKNDMPQHDVIAAIAGDDDAQSEIIRQSSEVDPRQLDDIGADVEHLVLDADSSQQRVIKIVQKGQHCIIQGPPGTGKSQTIANLIASLAAEGKRILFVAEKRAALSVVLDRLERVGLGHLALDLHGADLTRQEIIKKVGRSLELMKESAPVNPAELHRQFEERRRKLNTHVARMHDPKPPAGQSLFDVQSRLLKLRQANTTVRWRDAELDRFTDANVDKIRDLLNDAGTFEGLFLRTGESPWTGAALRNGKAAQEAIQQVQRLSGMVAELRQRLVEIGTAGGVVPESNLQEILRFLALVSSLTVTLTTYSEDVFRHDLKPVVQSLRPAGLGFIQQTVAWCFDASFRNAVRQARTLRRDPEVSASQLFSELTAAVTRIEEWRELANSRPVRVNPGRCSTALQSLTDELSRAAKVIPSLRNDVEAVDSLERRLAELSATQLSALQLPRLYEIEDELVRLGLIRLIEDFRSNTTPSNRWLIEFEWARLSSILERLQQDDPQVAAFHGRAHDTYVEEFKALDQERIKLARLRVRRAHAERVIMVMNKHPKQNAVLQREAEKKKRHLPIRRLLTEAPDVLTALCPCWMASPLSVSQLLPPERNCFDYVIFDEASQVLPEDAIPSIYRGRYLAVAGDKHQLPPTTFFAVQDAAEEMAAESDDATEGFESLLDLGSTFLQSASLDWHYRSRDERLIAFSNRHIYGERLVTFPSPGGVPSVSHVLVNQPVLRDGEEDTSSAEVEKVVQLVLEHARTRPLETLGVIAMGITHAQRIEAALDVALRERRELDAFFDQSRSERFFVKNLERVQGDERDAIILTIGYGKDRSGKLLYRFGPLNQAGGERRLNVAVTRSRCRLTLVSSFNHLDMEPQRSRSTGVKLLRSYLEYASTSGRQFGDATVTSVPLNDFESDVMHHLSSNGIQLVPQLGTSRYRIDLVAQHPEQPGNFVLAIECDGATYHSAPTARDRDRLRQQHLEALGWKFHRIWSTDWFLRKDEEIERALQTFRKAVASESSPPAASAPMQPVSETVVATSRAPRPYVPPRDSIGEYGFQELVHLIRWIKSDGQLRTDDEILVEAIRELGFKRRGSKIETTLKRAIRSAAKQ